MKKIMNASFSKVYMISVVLISLLMLGGYFSYAMFTVSKERKNAVSIVTGNLIYDLTVDGDEVEKLVVPKGTTKVFTVTLSNPNNRIARFNFYYLGSLPNGVSAGYSLLNGGMETPKESGINLEKDGTSGSSNTYRIVVVNDSNNSVTINLGVSVGLDYNDLTLPSNGHLFGPVKKGPAGDVIITNQDGTTPNDGDDTFITGEDPINYVWYSGKLWRAVSVNNEENTVKLITEWPISYIAYNSDSSNNSSFDGSYAKTWLNDDTVDGFLNNLRDYENFIKVDSKWNATMSKNTTKPSKTTMIESPVGLLNLYEYKMSYTGTTYSDGYLNDGLFFWTLTPYDSGKIWTIDHFGNTVSYPPIDYYGMRPVINLKSNIEIEDGDGTEGNPYRLKGDNDKNLEGTRLSTRFSGEYVRFGVDENNLYRIVSKEDTYGVKLTSSDPLQLNGEFKKMNFGSNTVYSSSNTVGSFLNGAYLSNGTYLTSEQVKMIESNTEWYLGGVGDGGNYKLAKYSSNGSLTTSKTKAKIGLLRVGELMSSQFKRNMPRGGTEITNFVIPYWTLTRYYSGNFVSIRISIFYF